MEIYGDPIVLVMVVMPISSIHIPSILASYGTDAMFIPGQPFAIINETGETWLEYRVWLVGKETDGSPFPYVRFADVNQDLIVYEGPGTAHLYNTNGVGGPDLLAITDINISHGDTLFFNADIRGYPPEGLATLDIMGEAFNTVISDAAQDNTPFNSHLFQNYPNPFNPITKISFNLEEKAQVLLYIYDIEGKMIKSLVNGFIDSGYNEVTWDGTDSNGDPVSSGVYFYRLKANGKTLTKKMVLLK
jgi:hypothetical protein